MTYRKKFIPEANLRKMLKHRDHPRLDDQESQPKQDFADSSKLLSEIRGLDHLADEAIKSQVGQPACNPPLPLASCLVDRWHGRKVKFGRGSYVS